MKTVFSLDASKLFSGLVAFVLLTASICGSVSAEEHQVMLEFDGGHELGDNDFGRPINLMAAALGVTPAQFRKAFAGVTPAKDHKPTSDEQRANKRALMSVLGPLGVTNDQMDEVASYYRFRPQDGELWPTVPAEGYAILDKGTVKRIVLTNHGAGYNTPPRVNLWGRRDFTVKARLSYGQVFERNGEVAEVVVLEMPGEIGAKAFVSSFYDWYISSKACDDPGSVLKLKSKLLSPAMIQGFKGDEAARTAAKGEVDCLDFDPFLATNAEPRKKYVVGKVTPLGQHYLVEVFGMRDGKREAKWVVRPEVSMENNHWQFVNLHYPLDKKLPMNENLLSVFKILGQSRAGQK